jgi:tetratricopeptide (TPR) repeat protein
MGRDRMPFSRALLWILVSTLLISGSAFMGWLHYLHVRERRLQDEQYRIVAIVQSTPQAEALKTVYLAELLDLSLDRPKNLYQFSAREAEKKLVACPLIKRAVVKKILPGTLYIEYDRRLPVAYLGDYTNTAIDEEGYLFPFRPFFTPKRLPTIYLGLDQEGMKWGNCLQALPSLQLALDILRQFAEMSQESFHIKQLDLSQAQADSDGQRQVVLVLEELGREWTQSSSYPIYLRLSPDHYQQDLKNFRTLYKVLGQQRVKEETWVIDLRIPHLAFLKRGS